VSLPVADVGPAGAPGSEPGATSPGSGSDEPQAPVAADRVTDPADADPSPIGELPQWHPEEDDILPSRSIMTRSISLRRSPAASDSGRGNRLRRGVGDEVAAGRADPTGDPSGTGQVDRFGARAAVEVDPGSPDPTGAPARLGWESVAPAGSTPAGKAGRAQRRSLRKPTPEIRRVAQAGKSAGSEKKGRETTGRGGSTSVLNRPLGELFKRGK